MKQLLQFLLVQAVIFLTACTDKYIATDIEARSLSEEPVNALHDKVRTQPYPKLSNELYLNPSPLIVPQSLKNAAFLQFALSQDSCFNDSTTLISDTVEWCMFNPHQILNTGKWYWRYRNVSSNGQNHAWSATIPFEVKENTPVFVTPSFADFYLNIPHQHPRLFCFLDPDIDEARKNVTTHQEYQRLLSRAQSAMIDRTSYEALITPYKESNMSKVSSNIDFLYQAYHLTRQPEYADKVYDILSILLEHPFADSDLFKTNFGATYITYCHLASYDLLYSRLTPAERTGAERVLMKVAGHYFEDYCGMQENHIFDNHFWQHNMRTLFQVALILHDKVGYEDVAAKMLEYYYELWTARAPASGFNRDGAWINGMSYFDANVKTLYYIPKLLSHITGQDFLNHPWYQQAGQALTYSWAPNSKSTGFGDSSEKADSPSRQRTAFADFLARELNDSYAGWYATQCRKDLLNDVDLRLYRMTSPLTYSSLLPANAPKLKWYKDIGEVVMHSDLSHTNNNLTLSFRSSTFGSGSHTHADQNAFNLLYKGKEVYYHTGYYLNFSDAHNLTSYRHTRAHNSLLVNGIGQPFSTEGYGMVLRAAGGTNIGYCLGDASNAYRGISNDPLWINAFQKAGIAQIPENGFGTTPLTQYRRQMLMLYPNIILIYDELEASQQVKWDWLLHSPVQFNIIADSLTFTTSLPESGSKAVAKMFTNATCEVSQNDLFIVPPTSVPNDPKYPNQWHLTASIENNSATRILTVIQVQPANESIIPVMQNDNQITCGKWTIHANLDASSPGYLNVRNSETPVIYSYGADNPFINGETYFRQSAQSSILYDEIDGRFQIIESIDCNPVHSRSLK